MSNDWKIIQESIAITRVFVDDVELEGIRSVRYTTEVGELPIIVLEITPGSVNAEDDSTDSNQHFGFTPSKNKGVDSAT